MAENMTPDEARARLFLRDLAMESKSADDDLNIALKHLKEWRNEILKDFIPLSIYKCCEEQRNARREQVELLQQALEDIVDPIAAMKRKVPEGAEFNMDRALRIGESLGHLQGIARGALKARQEMAKRYPPYSGKTDQTGAG